MTSDTKKMISATAETLVNDGFLASDGCLSLREGDRVYICRKGADLSALKDEDLLELSLSGKSGPATPEAHGEAERHLHVYRKREDISALINCTSPSVVCSSRAGEVVRPLLDDMAQIVGTTLRTAPAGMDGSSLKKTVKAMKGRNSVLLKGRGALCGSGTMDDAHAICQVSEKACKAWIESAFLGGGHKINALESALMRLVYLKKYSKQAVRNTR